MNEPAWQPFMRERPVPLKGVQDRAVNGTIWFEDSEDPNVQLWRQTAAQLRVLGLGTIASGRALSTGQRVVVTITRRTWKGLRCGRKAVEALALCGEFEQFVFRFAYAKAGRRAGLDVRHEHLVPSSKRFYRLRWRLQPKVA